MASDSAIRGRPHLPCPWLPKVQPEVEELEPSLSGPGQPAAEKHPLGRLQYSLDYDFQSGQVGVEEGDASQGSSAAPSPQRIPWKGG